MRLLEKYSVPTFILSNELRTIQTGSYSTRHLLAISIGVGAGKFLGNGKIFARKKLQKSDVQKKTLHVILGATFFSNRSMLGAIFAHIFRECVKVFRYFARVLKRGLQLLANSTSEIREKKRARCTFAFL